MPNDQYQEVLIVIVSSTLLLGLLVGILVFLMLNYQKKRFLYLEEKRMMKEEYDRNLLQSRIEIQEETFDDISKEIHDNVGQLLSLAKVQLNILQQQPGDRELLGEVKDNVGQAMTDLRDVAKSLSTTRLQQVTILAAITQELQRVERGRILKCEVSTTGDEARAGRMSEQNKIILFRSVQESLQNIIKHAEARMVKTAIVLSDETIKVSIADDGVGFDLSLVNPGLGIENLRKRAAMVGGQTEIISMPGKGTEVIITIPYA